MFYDKKTLNNVLILLQKPYINNNFFISNYFFLTNNFIPFSNFLYPLVNTYFLNSFYLNIKKNSFFFYKLFNQNRKYFLIKKYLFNNKLKFNRYFHFILNKHLFKNKKPLNRNFFFNFYPNYFLKNYNLYFFKNWNFLVGSLISPYSWDLHSTKKSIRKNLTLNFVKNTFYYNKTNKSSSVDKTFFNSFISKKLFVNNFFYFKKFNITYNNLNYLTKISSATLNKNSFDWFFSKPYLFLNNYESIKFNNKYPNYLTIALFKNYLKFFNQIKKFNFNLKLKSSNDIFFKNFTTSFSLLLKSPNNIIHSISQNKINFFSYFNFKNFFFPTLFSSYRKKNFKKFNKFVWLLSFSPRTRVLRRNKIFTPLNLIKKNDLYSFNTKITRISKRLKKLYIWNTLYSFNKSAKLLNLKWIKKSFFFTFNRHPVFNKNFYFKNINLSPKFNFFSINFFKSSKFILKSKTFKFSKNSLIYFKNSHVFNNFKKPIFFSKEKNFFILSKYGFLFTTGGSDTSYSKTKLFYNLKKLIYSFSYKNEIQRFILKRYVKSNFLTNFYSNNSTPLLSSISGDHFSNFSETDFNLSFFNSFFKKNSEALFLLNESFYPSNKWNYYNNQLIFAKNYFADDSNFIIKRVRFKPGYMSLAREVRSVLKTSLSLNFRYQYKLTNYLTKYNKFINFKTFLVSEMCLLNLLIRSRLLPDHSLCLLFIKNNLVYLNGIVCSNQNLQVFVGDFLQLIVSLKYYILYKWFLNLSLKKKNRLKNISRKKMIVPAENDEKKRSSTLPKWVLFSKNSIDDVAKYIEVDYFTLSAMILYEPFLWSDLNPYNLIDQRFGVINLYNWKYIN